MPAFLAALLCVCGIAAGQLLFKCTANSQAISGSYLHPHTLLWLLSALLLYGITTFGWIWTLQQDSFPHLSLDGAGIRDCAAAKCSTAGGTASTDLLARRNDDCGRSQHRCSQLKRTLAAIFCGLLVVSCLLIGRTTPSFHQMNMLIWYGKHTDLG